MTFRILVILLIPTFSFARLPSAQNIGTSNAGPARQTVQIIDHSGVSFDPSVYQNKMQEIETQITISRTNNAALIEKAEGMWVDPNDRQAGAEAYTKEQKRGDDGHCTIEQLALKVTNHFLFRCLNDVEVKCGEASRSSENYYSTANETHAQYDNDRKNQTLGKSLNKVVGDFNRMVAVNDQCSNAAIEAVNNNSSCIDVIDEVFTEDRVFEIAQTCDENNVSQAMRTIEKGLMETGANFLNTVMDNHKKSRTYEGQVAEAIIQLETIWAGQQPNMQMANGQKAPDRQPANQGTPKHGTL